MVTGTWDSRSFYHLNGPNFATVKHLTRFLKRSYSTAQELARFLEWSVELCKGWRNLEVLYLHITQSANFLSVIWNNGRYFILCGVPWDTSCLHWSKTLVTTTGWYYKTMDISLDILSLTSNEMSLLKDLSQSVCNHALRFDNLKTLYKHCTFSLTCSSWCSCLLMVSFC